MDNVDGSRSSPKISEIEQIRYLRNKGTNFIFLFGKQAVGKTAITASLIQYLNTECHYGTLEKNGNPEGQRMWEIIRQTIAGGRFPDRTGDQNVYEVESIFIPSRNRSHLSRLSLTFLEMGGSTLSEVSIRKSGRLPSNVDIYFKAGTLSLTFIMVTSYDEANEDDQLMVNFLDYITQKSSRFRDARVLLLVSKWDKYQGGGSVRDFLMNQMPQTFRRLRRPTNGYGTFTLGTIEENVDDSPYIQSYDSRPARKVFEWIYETLTGKKIS